MRLRQAWVLPISIVILIIPIVLIEYNVMFYTNGTFGYPMDDVFIHMAIAKNIAAYHIWGTSPHEFASASSSILYPLILASIYYFSGPSLIAPFLVNLFASIIFIWRIQVWLKQQGLSPLRQLLIIIIGIIIIPLPIITLVGMEHTIQILVSYLFIYELANYVSKYRASALSSWPVPWNIMLLAILNTAIRYEGVFLIFLGGVTLVYYKKWATALFLGLCGIMPILIFGIYSLAKGSYFFPNPVLLKSTVGGSRDLWGVLDNLTNGVINKLFYFEPDKSSVAMERLLIIIPISSLLYNKFIETRSTYRTIVILLSTATLLHMAIANTTWFYRYEAYLVAASVPMLGVLYLGKATSYLSNVQSASKVVYALALLILTFPFILRSIDAYKDTAGACKNLYEQDYLAGKFLGKYYDTTAIALNDLGAMSYYTSGNNLDFWGLGNVQVAKSKRNNYYNETLLDSLAERSKVKIAVLPGGRYPILSSKWKKVGAWHISNKLVLGVSDLCFFAVDTTLAPRLKENLKNFEITLPEGVSTTYNK